MNQRINATLEIAENSLSQAKEGLCRPEEDVVPYSVCKSAYQAIINYLSSFLLRNGRELPENVTVQELLTFSREVDSNFGELHLAPFYHPTETEDVWMNMDTAKDFVSMAEKTRAMVRELSNAS